MRYIWSILLPVLLSLAGCDATTPEEPGDSTTSTTSPAGFETWLVAQCPNSAAISVAEGDGSNAHVVACESVREKALADPATRDQLVMAYWAQSEEAPIGAQRNVRGKTEGGDGELIGGTSEALTSIGGLACTLVALGPGLIFGWPGQGCAYARNPRVRRACEATTGGFSAGAGILCAIAAFF